MTTDLTAHIDTLEKHVHQAAMAAGIEPQHWQPFFAMLSRLKTHNPRMYAHSLRVGLYAAGLARHEGSCDIKLALFGGCGHDIGKARVSNRLLDAKNLSPAGYRQIQTHSRHGFEFWKDKHFLYTAFVTGLHHRFQEHGYGIDLETDSPIPLTPQAKSAIETTARLVMIADHFDALTTRDDERNPTALRHNPVAQRAAMVEHFPEAKDRVAWLFAHQIHLA